MAEHFSRQYLQKIMEEEVRLGNVSAPRQEVTSEDVCSIDTPHHRQVTANETGPFPTQEDWTQMLFSLEMCRFSSSEQETNEKREFANFFDFLEENQGELPTGVDSWIKPIENRLSDLMWIRCRRERRIEVRRAKLQAEAERDRLHAEGKTAGRYYVDVLKKIEQSIRDEIFLRSNDRKSAGNHESRRPEEDRRYCAICHYPGVTDPRMCPGRRQHQRAAQN